MNDATTYTARLTQADYEESVGGWRCPVLMLPGVKVRALYVNSRQVDESSYAIKAGHIRYSGDRPAEATALIELGGALAESQRWKLLAIVLPVVGSIAAALIAATSAIYVERRKQPTSPTSMAKQSYIALKPSSTGEPTLSDLSLGFDNNVVSGDSTGDGKSWVISGYTNSGFMVLADRSTKPEDIGFGVTIVESVSGSTSEYVGYWRGNWCNRQKTPNIREIRGCPVVLVKGERGLVTDEARRKYKDLLQPGGCVLAPLVPEIPKLACPPL